MFFNYAFLVVWPDAAWWWLSPASHETRTTGVSAAIHGFLFFMFVNGAVVFADGWMRVIGIIAVGTVSLAWSTKLRAERRGTVAGRRFYYGWIVPGVAALAMVGTLPGRTQGLGLITEPLIRDLGVGRIAYAQST